MPSKLDKTLSQILGRKKYRMAQHGALIDIGGIDEPTDLCVPEVFVSRWGGHKGQTASLRLRHADADFVKAKHFKEINQNGKLGLDWSLEKRTHRITQGSTKYEIIYTDKAQIPTEAVPFMLIESGGLSYHPQPALTAVEIAEGCYRPEDIIDSIAIYGQWQGVYVKPNGIVVEDYGCGKFGHIKRSKWLAGDGAGIWVQQWVESGVLWVAVPWDFIHAHPGPWTLDPTFGYTNIGGSQAGYGPGIILTKGLVGGVNGTLDSVSFYFYQAQTDNYVGCVYDGNASAGLIANSTGSSVAGAGWKGFTLSSESVTANTTYYMGCTGGDGVQAIPYAYDTAGAAADQGKYRGVVGTPAVINDLNTIARFFSAYATYTESGGGGPVIPIFMNQYKQRWA